MYDLSTNELLTYLQVINILLAEVEVRLKKFDTEDTELWSLRRKQLLSARNEIYDVLGTRILNAVGINWER